LQIDCLIMTAQVVVLFVLGIMMSG
jgi:hypothetical protein